MRLGSVIMQMSHSLLFMLLCLLAMPYCEASAARGEQIIIGNARVGWEGTQQYHLDSTAASDSLLRVATDRKLLVRAYIHC
jgi:hypothetical protein